LPYKFHQDRDSGERDRKASDLRAILHPAGVFTRNGVSSSLASIMISKSRILRQIVEELSRALETLAGAARVMHADASDEQNKAEDKYDTRGLETAYLASSQARQATETEQALAQYQSLKLQKFTAKTLIDVTALVELESRGTRTFYFLGPKSGGIEVQVSGQEILVITPESPLGKELVGKKVGDRIKLQTRGPAQEFRILSVW
jgi:transcription elongation GreA/GreB family factor